MSTMNVIPRSVSDIIKSEDSDEPKKRSRDEWRKAKELEEARKAGTAPALVDEHGKDINPHIPQYIATTPWYFGSQAPTLKHQRQLDEKNSEVSAIDDYYPRGQKGGTATRFRRGACDNCGAITHQKKDCLERPRKVGAKYSGENFVADEMVLPKLALDYDGKRDRWNGYQPEMYKLVIDEHKKVEDAKRLLKEEKLKQDLMIAEKGKDKSVDNVESDSDSDEDEKYADHIDMPGTKVDSKQRITVRNLRIREDTAKYLRNLDPESAFYDPKTRSMRDNPYKNTGKTPEELQYAGENFVRFTGDATNVSNAQLFAWQAYDKGVDIHLQAEPTKAELVHKEFNLKKEDYKEGVRDKVLQKYGGEEHLNVPPKELIFAQNENYVEYSRQGEVIKGSKKPIIRSVYDEDVKINNHTSVWGSFWQNHQWGYKCCHSFIKNSYCTGNVAEQSVDLINATILLQENTNRNDDESTSDLDDSDDQSFHAKKFESNKKLNSKTSEQQNNVEDDDDAKKEKLKKAIENEEYNALRAERLLQMDERKRPYNSMYDVKEPTSEEIEAFHIKRKRDEDPMAAFLTK